MSYHVTILRSRAGRRLPIARAEAEAAVAARRGLTAEEQPDGTLHVTVAGKGEESPLLVWQDGELWTGNPDDETLRLMLELAEALGARVRGDELETCRTVDETFRHPDDAAEAEAGARLVARARRTGWLVRFLPFVVAAVALAVAFAIRALR